jgi:glycosyltransferase involved in cell wall biosynthesis
MKNIFYYHTLKLSFKSAQTIQIIKDYAYLSRFGYKIYLYGKKENEKDFKEILNFLKEFPNVKIFESKRDFIKKFVFSNNPIVVTRHINKLKKINLLKKIKSLKIVHEMHEESFPYLFKKSISKNSFFYSINSVDLILFTNKSQLLFFEKEFNMLPKTDYLILPNGVEVDKFKNIKRKNNKVLVYTGQFNKWKNVEILFAALSFLPKDFTLKIAGGQHKKDKKYIKYLIDKYNVPDRVYYSGYIPHLKIPEFINNTNALLVPLGNNIQSKYLTSPMKLIEYMATEIPIVTIDYPSIKGLSCSEFLYKSSNNPEAFVKNIVKAVNEKMDYSNRLECIKKLSYKNRSEEFHKNLQKVFK